MKFPAASVLILLSTAAAFGQDPSTDKRVETVLGEPEAFHQTFAALQAGVRERDSRKVAALVRYPINVRVEGRRRLILDQDGFVANYRKIITPRVAHAITAQHWQNVHVSSRGIMLGQGEVWLDGVCRDTMCRMFDPRVITIQDGASRTKPAR